MSLPMISTAMNEPDKQEVQRGIDVIIYDPVTLDDTDTVIHIEFGDSARKALTELKLQGMKKISKSNKPKKLNRPGFRGFRLGAQEPVEKNVTLDNLTMEDCEPYLTDFMAACTVSWNLSKWGEGLECTRENAVKLYTDYPFIKKQVYDQIENNFGLEDVIESSVFGHTDAVSSQASRRHWSPMNRYLAEGNFEQAAREVEDASGETLAADFTHALRLTDRMIPLWKGQELKRLAVVFFNGYGDEIIMARYLRALCGRAERVSALVSKATRTLFEKNTPAEVDVFDHEHASDALRDADAHVYSFCLPHETRQGYGEAAWIKNWSHDATNFPTTRPARIGINWTGSKENVMNNLRSVPVARLAPLFEIPGIEWHSLQPDRRAVPPDGVIDHADSLRSFLDTVHLIATLDLVISIDSSVVNLAASMGFPTWALLEPVGEADFRWGMGQERTPWFPSVRMFRQGNDRKWKSVIRRVTAALAEWKGARDYEARTRIVTAAGQALNLGR